MSGESSLLLGGEGVVSEPPGDDIPYEDTNPKLPAGLEEHNGAEVVERWILRYFGEGNHEPVVPPVGYVARFPAPFKELIEEDEALFRPLLDLGVAAA